jgi:putative transposase
MSTYKQIIYQIVFGTKNRNKCLAKDNRSRLYEYIIGILQNNKCHVYGVNGMEDHIHILIHLHPSVSLASLIKDVKLATSALIKENDLFKDFSGWQSGYGAFTYSVKEKGTLIAYVNNQEEHHRKITYEEEYISLLTENEIEFDKKYLW